MPPVLGPQCPSPGAEPSAVHDSQRHDPAHQQRWAGNQVAGLVAAPTRCCHDLRHAVYFLYFSGNWMLRILKRSQARPAVMLIRRHLLARCSWHAGAGPGCPCGTAFWQRGPGGAAGWGPSAGGPSRVRSGEQPAVSLCYHVSDSGLPPLCVAKKSPCLSEKISKEQRSPLEFKLPGSGTELEAAPSRDGKG